MGVEQRGRFSLTFQREPLPIVPGGQERGGGRTFGTLVLRPGEMEGVLPGQAAGQGLKEGFGTAVSNIVMMIIMITVNLGIVNLLPLPALDGGRLLFLIWEGVSRKPVPAKYEGYIHAAGFVLLLGLMVLIAFNDVLRLIRG